MAGEGDVMEDRKSTNPMITKSCSTNFPLWNDGRAHTLLYCKMTDDDDVLVNVTTQVSAMNGDDVCGASSPPHS